MISLLILLFILAKCGEPKPMLMSLQGDINLVMLETSVKTVDTVAFMYDDQFGGFAINPSFCPLENGAGTSFITSKDCSVQPHTEFDQTPFNLNYLVSHKSNSPSHGSETNFIIGHRGFPGSVAKSVFKNGEAFAFTDIQKKLSKQYTEIYCNNKNHKHYQNLFEPGYNDYTDNAVILFGKGNKSEYEQTMKCIGLLSSSANILYAARLFTIIISDLRHQPFSFQAIGFGEQGAFRGFSSNLPFYIGASNVNKSSIETNFVFRSVASSGCPPKIIMQPTSERKPGLLFSYNLRKQTMPRIEADNSHSCGIALGQSATSHKSLFRYYCECKA